MKFPDRQPPQWDHPSFTFKTPCSKAFAWLFSSQSIPFLRLCLSEFWSGLKYYLKKSYHYKNSTITQQQKIGRKKKMQLHKTKTNKKKGTKFWFWWQIVLQQCHKHIPDHLNSDLFSSLKLNTVCLARDGEKLAQVDLEIRMQLQVQGTSRDSETYEMKSHIYCFSFFNPGQKKNNIYHKLRF